MSCHIPGCPGNYDFERIAGFALQRFVEGCSTITLLRQARSDREKEEIALVSLLDVEDDNIRDLQLCCSNAADCEIFACRNRLKTLIAEALAGRERRTAGHMQHP